MTTLSSRSEILSLPVNGASSLRLTNPDLSSDEGDGTLSAFGDMLADMAPEISGKDEKNDDQSSPAETGELNLSALMIVDMLPKSAAKSDWSALQRFSAVNASEDVSRKAAWSADGDLLLPVDADPDLRVAEGGGSSGRLADVNPPTSLQAPSSRNQQITPQGGVAVGQTPDRNARGSMAQVNPLTVMEWRNNPDKIRLDAESVNPSEPAYSASKEQPLETPLKADGPTFSLPVHVSKLESYLPPVLANALDEFSASSEQSNPAAMIASQPETLPPARLKILTFDLHPEQLGPVTVRMRMSRSHVEIAIDVRTEDARVALSRTSDAIVEAIAGHGLTLEPPDIRLASPPSAMESSSPMNNQSSFAGADGFAQGQGRAHHDEKSAFSQHNWGSDQKSGQAQSVATDPGDITGVYL